MPYKDLSRLKAYKENNKERIRLLNSNGHLKRKFGVDEIQYQELYNKQKGCCAICGKHSSEFQRRLALDHDHVSGEIRGLLCFVCNKRIVGRFRKGINSHFLLKGYEYLEREYTGWIVPAKRKKRKKKRGKRKSIQVRRKLDSLSPLPT